MVGFSEITMDGVWWRLKGFILCLCFGLSYLIYKIEMVVLMWWRNKETIEFVELLLLAKTEERCWDGLNSYFFVLMVFS